MRLNENTVLELALLGALIGLGALCFLHWLAP